MDVNTQTQQQINKKTYLGKWHEMKFKNAAVQFVQYVVRDIHGYG